MFQIDLKSRKPIYEQVMDNFKRLVASGAMKAGEKVPSVRDMAKILTCNPNTIQKAYRELESQGYFYTVLGQGSFIASPPDEDRGRIEAVYKKIFELIVELEFLGESKKNIAERILQESNNSKGDID